MRFILLFLFASVSQVFGSQIIEKSLCVESAFDLVCNDGSLLEIVELILGDSTCYKTNCCPSSTDCRGSVSYEHKNHVNNVCNGRQRCHFNVQKRNIGCVWYAPNNDYELVRYKCNEDPNKKTTTARINIDEPSIIIPFLMDKPTHPPSSTIEIFPDENPIFEISRQSDTEYDTPNPQRPEYENTENLKFVIIADTPSPQRSEYDNTENKKIVNLEPIVIPAVAGLILTTLIISIACIVTKSIKLKYLRQKTVNQDFSGMYLQPISYQTLVRTCAAEENACNETNQGCSVECDTYDCIKDICNSLEDGYLKPADVIGQSSSKKDQEEDRYVLA